MSFSASNLNASELCAVKSGIQNADNYGNNENIELNWAMKAYDHASVHYNLISSLDAKELKLTKIDDSVYEDFRAQFPDFNVTLIIEDDLKTPAAKEKWRNFIESYKGHIEDYNMGTLLRLDCGKDYSPENTTLSIRAQFLAIEIARNKEGHNTALSSQKKEKEGNDS